MGEAVTADRDELRATAAKCGWVLAFSCPTLDQYTLTPPDCGGARREVTVYFTAAGVMSDAYESYTDEQGRFLGRGVAAGQVAATMTGDPQDTVPGPPEIEPAAMGAGVSANTKS